MKVPDATLQFAHGIGFEEPGQETEGRSVSEHPQTAVSCEEDFAALVKRQSRFAYQVAHALLRNAADSEDAVQEVFLKLYRNGSWRQAEDERAFLARATWRVAATRLRKGRREASMQAFAKPEERNAEASVISDSQLAAVHRVIDSLPEELRQPLALSAVEEMSSREIAAAMGIAEGTVRTRLMRARQMVRQKLEALRNREYAK